MAIVLAPVQALVGDAHGQNTAKVQPAKIAAVEAHWDGSEPAPLVLFALPDERSETNRYEIAIPGGASWFITHSATGLFPGLKDFAVQDRPPVWGPFFGFRIMVGVGLLMIAMAFWGGFLWWRGRLESAPFYMRLASFTWPLGFIAVLAGWTVTEQGRQPWLATGILRTADAVSPVGAVQVAVTLVLFVLVYAIIFMAGITYINRLINRGPTPEEKLPEGVANRPLTAATSPDATVGAGS
jgi:cytochrome d ubiquinol oxidase subunit I